MNGHAEKRHPMFHVSLKRPIARYGLAASGVLLGWWFFQAGQAELGAAAMIWGLSEF